MRVLFTIAGIVVGIALSFATSSQSIGIVLAILTMCFWFLLALFVASNRNMYDKEKMQAYYTERLMNELAEKQKELDNAYQYQAFVESTSDIDRQVLEAERALLDDVVAVLKNYVPCAVRQDSAVQQLLERYAERRS